MSLHWTCQLAGTVSGIRTVNGALLRLDEGEVLDARLVSRPRLDRLAGWGSKNNFSFMEE
jgi:hypothetical protein